MPHHDIKTNPPATPPRRVATVPSHTDTTHTQRKTPYTTTDQSEPPRALVLTLQILAYAIPLGFLAYVLYINYLPFGYDKTFTIDVGAEGDTTVGEFYLEPSPDLSERMIAEDGTTYRELNGMANVIFKPNVVLKDAEITVSVEGEGVSIIPPVIDFNPDDYEWDYEWDFTNPETAFTPKTSERARAEWTSCTTTISTTSASTTPAEMGTGTISEDTEEFVPVPISADNVPVPISATTTEICEPIPVPDLVGNAFFFDGALTFNGSDSRLNLPNSYNKFEQGPFSVYVEWIPNNPEGNSQQIIGHFNWEVWQNSNSVQLRVGRLSNEHGRFVDIRYTIPENFFFNKNYLLVNYIPASIEPYTDGYIELLVNGIYVGRVSLKGESIFEEYGDPYMDLVLGKTYHNYDQYSALDGSIYDVKFSYNKTLLLPQNISLVTGTSFNFSLMSESISNLEKIHVEVK